jgi:putative exporter of polyketide antibiotics
MPFFLLITGTVLIIAAARGTHKDLFRLLEGDFTGPRNFVYWFVSILLIGMIGYIPKLKPLSDGFLVLLIIVIFLKKGTGLFDMFNEQIDSTLSAKPTTGTGSTVSTIIGGVSGIGASGATGGNR